MKNTAIREYLETRRDEITELLARLVKAPSVRSEAREGAPFGLECRRMLELTREIYAEYGYESRLSDGGYLVTEVGEGERSVGIFAHADVVPAGEGWTMCEPFEPLLADGILYGRGSADNKSAILISLFTAEALKALGIELSSRLILVTGSNEESGMADMPVYLAENTPPDVSLVPDGLCAVIRGEKGIMRFYATSRERLECVTDFHGGEALNVVLGNAEISFAYSDVLFAELSKICESSERLTLSRDGGIRIFAKGISSHASEPKGSLNAAKLILDALASVSLPERDRELLASAASLLDDDYGESFGSAAADDCLGRTTCVNATVSLEDGHLRLGFDVRFVGASPRAKIEATLDSLGFDCETVRDSVGYLHAEDDRFMNRILDVYRDLTGFKAEAVTSGGGTYSRVLPRAYSVGDRLYSTTPHKLPKGHGSPHQPDEFVPISALLDQIAIIAETVVALDAELHG